MGKDGEFSVKITGFTSSLNSDEVRRVFEDAGFNTITDVYLPPRKGFGFVRFSEELEASAAADMQDLVIRGEKLNLELAVGKKKGSAELASERPMDKGYGKESSDRRAEQVYGKAYFDSRGGKAEGKHGGHGPSFDVTQYTGRSSGPPTRSSGEHSVWVGNLPGHVKKDELREMFQSRGIDTMTDVYIPGGKGFGFVRFATLAEVNHALDQCQGMPCGDVELELKASFTEKKGSAPPAGKGGAPHDAGKRGKGGHMDSHGYGPPAGFGGYEGYGPPPERYGPPPGSYGPPGVGQYFDEWGAPLGHGGGGYEGGGYGGGGYGDGGYGGRGGGFVGGGFADGYGYDQRGGHGPPAGYDHGFGGGHGPPSRGHDQGGGHGPPSKKSRGEHSVWVGNIPDSCTKEELEDVFKGNGVDTMTDVYIPPGKDFGFVRFATEREVDDAVAKCQHVLLGDKELQLRSSQTESRGGTRTDNTSAPRADTAPAGHGYRDDAYGGGGGGGKPSGGGGKGKDRGSEVSVKVNNLPAGMGSNDVREAFNACGVDSMTDVYVPRGRNYGFLRFAAHSEAQAAMDVQPTPETHDFFTEVTLELAEGDKKSSQDIIAERSGGKGRAANHNDQAAYDTSSGEVSLKVSNLPPDVTSDEVCEAFASQGINTMTDCYLPRGQKFGFLRFATTAEGNHALKQRVSIGGYEVGLEFAASKKRSSQEMAGGDAPRNMRDTPARDEGEPSIKVTGLPADTSSDELHSAVTVAGCRGGITDVYIPKGNRGFGFVRFSSMREAESCSRLQLEVRGSPCTLEISVGKPKGKKEMVAQDAGHGHGPAAGYGPSGGGYGPAPGYGGHGPPNDGWCYVPMKGGCGPGAGYGPASGYGPSDYDHGPYGGKGGKGGKGYW